MFRQYGALDDRDEETSLFTEDNLTHMDRSTDDSLPSQDYRTDRQLRYTFNHWFDRLSNKLTGCLISCKNSISLCVHSIREGEWEISKIYPPSRNVMIVIAIFAFVVGMYFLVSIKGTGIAEYMNGWVMWFTHPAVK